MTEQYCSLFANPVKTVSIVNVWNHNLEEQFAEIKKIIDHYPIIAMDTEFPGVPFKPHAFQSLKNPQEQMYRMVACNVNRLKVIQIGFAFMNEQGQLPSNRVWQFNFHFDLDTDSYAKASIDLLKSCNIDFELHKKQGIRMCDFGSLLTSSGLVCEERWTWITYHSAYDFSYVIRTMILRNLPMHESEFLQLVKDVFPRTFDVKLLADSCDFDNRIKEAKQGGGLQNLSFMLGVPRYGTQHQAGSDALLTGQTFLALKHCCLQTDEGRNNWIELEEQCVNNVYGLSELSTSQASEEESPPVFL
ncbi:hypothetical protein L596_017136 [Steinernema carpocapsae]|uniref:poly(A)-specific ribonuclease n=1 Tax=Steinernema carpocapsae TaxID=34508 RepID=A0A4V6A1M8_STECR|nr:hypothetical protein L596_017136 [Steinernema carpocapsae]